MNRSIRTSSGPARLLAVASAIGLFPDASNPARAQAPAQPAAAAPATKPKLDARFLQMFRQQRDQAKFANAGLPDTGETAFGETARLTLDGNVLRVRTASRIGPQLQKFRVAGTNAVWTAVCNPPLPGLRNAVGGDGEALVGTTIVTRVDADAAADEDLWSTSIQSTGTFVCVFAQSVLGRVSMTQYFAPPAVAGQPGMAPRQPVTLILSEMQGGLGGLRQVTTFTGTANSVAELRTKYPDEFRRHLLPAMTKISPTDWMTPGAADVYSAFPDIPADPAVAAELARLVPDLGAEAFPVREAAAAKLTGLGPAAVLAALRMDPKTLSAEQRGQLARLIAVHRRRAIPPAEARVDPTFLLDCLEHPDPAVRAAAKAALEKALGSPVPYDPAATGDPQAAAVDAVRSKVAQKLAADAAAATRPAE